MRKLSIGLLAMAVLVLAGSALVAEDEAMWLNPAGCYFCQPLTETEGLLDAVGWENHKIANGMVSITTYTPEWEKATKAAGAEMEKRWMGFDPTQDKPLCGMCQAWMKVPFDKLTMEKIEFNGGEMSLTTSSDEAVVAQLHEITDKTIAEMKKFQEMEKTGHEGHGH